MGRPAGIILVLFLLLGNPGAGAPPGFAPDTIPRGNPCEDRTAVRHDTIVVKEPLELTGVEVAAFNTSRRLLDVPGSVSLVPPARIEQEDPVTVLPLLNQVPGVFAHAGTLNTSRITIRGIGARVPYATGRIRAYFNQIPLTNGSGISILEHIDPGVVERIEITRGPASSAYGAGLGGTVTMTARQSLSRPTSLRTTLQAGSFGLLRNGFSLDAGKNRVASSLIYSRTRSEGFRENNHYRRDALTSVTQFRPHSKALITALVAWSDMKAGIPSSIDSMTFVKAPSSAAANWLATRGYEDTGKFLAGVSGGLQAGERLRLQGSLFATIHNEKEMRPFDVLYEARSSGGARIKTTYSLRTGESLFEFMAGGEVFLEAFRYRTHENPGGAGVEGGLVSRNREWIQTFNLFLQGELEKGRLTLSAGLNLHETSTDYSDLMRAGESDRSGRYAFGAIWSPRLSANYRYLRQHAVFATLSHGFAPPALSETLTPQGMIDPGIRPEKSWNLEAGIRGSLWRYRVFYDLGLYSMWVQDLLVAERVGPDSWVGRNAGASLHQGLEAEFQFVLFRGPADGSWWHPAGAELRSALSLNRFVFTDFIDRDTDHSGNRIPGIPDAVVHLEGDVRLGGGLHAAASWRLVGPMPLNDANDGFAKGYSLAGIRLGYRHRVGRVEAEGFVQVANLTDTHYASMVLVNAPSFGSSAPRYYYPGMPRNFLAGLALRFDP